MPQDQQFDYAKLPDGSYAKFPKGTSQDVIRAKLTSAGLLKPTKPTTGAGSGDPNTDTSLLSSKVTTGTKQIPRNYGFTPKNMLSNFATGVEGAARGTREMTKTLFNPYTTNNVNRSLQEFVFKPGDEQLRKAKEDFNHARLFEAAGHALAAALPILGPVAATLGEQAGKGDIGGAASQAAGMYGLGKATEAGLKISTDTLLDPAYHRAAAAKLDTAVLKTADATAKDYKLSTGLEVAQKRVMANMQQLPLKIEKIRAQQDAEVTARAQFHDARGTKVDAETEIQPLVQNVAARLNTQGLLSQKVRTALKAVVDQITTERGMATGATKQIDLRSLTMSKAIALAKGLGKMASWDAETRSAVEPFIEKIRQGVNNAISKADPKIGQLRDSEHRLIEARDAARKNYADALNEKKALGIRMIYGSAGSIGVFLSLKALGVIPTAAIGTVIMMKALLQSTRSRTTRAALHAMVADVLDGGIKQQATRPFAAAPPNVPQLGGRPTLPSGGPQGAANAGNGPFTEPSAGLPPMAPAGATFTQPKPLELPSQATRARAGSGDYVRPSVAKSTTSSQVKPLTTTDLEAIKAQGVGPEIVDSRVKAMMDRLDTLLARQPKSGAERNAIKRETDEIKRLLSGEAKGKEASAINKRIADRERLASKRAEAGATRSSEASGASGEAVSQSASPEMRAIALDAGYKALAKYEGGTEMVAALRKTAKAMQRVDPSYDEVEKLTEALQIMQKVSGGD